VYVIPGDGGGDGSLGNPYRGLQAAADASQPGDRILVASGTYTRFQLLTSGSEGHPIAFIGPGDGTAIVDGVGTDRGIVTLGEYNQTISHVIFEGMTIQNGHWGVDAQHSQDIVIRHNLIQDVDHGIINRRGDAQEGNQTVCDNQVYGRTPWPQTSGQIPGERGIDLRGYGNVVCHNTVRYFGDCVSLQPFTGPSFGNDVFGNDVSYCVDDGIEIDYNQANVRVWRNRATNARMGVSVQPIRGGPAYILRNELFNLESVPVKMHNYSTGFYVVNNTGVKHGNGYGDNGAMWRNAVLRNNFFLGTRYAFEFTTTADEGFRDLDYGAWGTNRAIGSPSDPYFKWDAIRYNRLPDLPPGVEDHGLPATFADLINPTLPSNWYTPAEPGSRDLRLVTAAKEIDSGAMLPNINDPFVMDGKPDMGAFEHGQPPPHYGPRLRLPDVDDSSKRASHNTPAFGETLTYTITILNTGAALTEPLTMTDVVPLGLEYLSGSLMASSGLVNENSAPRLNWYGNLKGTQPVTINYTVQINEQETRPISNTAFIQTSSLGSLERTATIIANGINLHLPLIAK
jgi:uncharacterized repeat protein (TIGR01451 family)